MDKAVQEGHYARKQIGCRSHLISWSHQRRFQTGLQLAAPLAGKTVLDYGSGDGTFLAMWTATATAPALAVGAELDTQQVEDCRKRLGGRPGLQFVYTQDLDAPEHQGRYDGLICMEVLEHVVTLDALLDRFERWLAPGGLLLISVPVETGVPLMVKQVARRIAGWRGLGDYPGTSPYTFSQMWNSVLAGSTQHIPRRVNRDPSGFESYDHKGFNWMGLRLCTT